MYYEDQKIFWNSSQKGEGVIFGVQKSFWDAEKVIPDQFDHLKVLVQNKGLFCFPYLYSSSTLNKRQWNDEYTLLLGDDNNDCGWFKSHWVNENLAGGAINLPLNRFHTLSSIIVICDDDLGDDGWVMTGNC